MSIYNDLLSYLKMKKILLITPRFPFPILGGDKDRFVGIANALAKKNIIDVICISDKYYQKDQSTSKLSYKIKIFRINFICRIIYSIIFLFKGNPLQVSFYYSKAAETYIQNKIYEYDSVIFHGIRSAQYLSKSFKGRKILEMTDLTSLNFKKIYKKMPYYNPLKYLYFIESYLIKKYENNISEKFNKIILISKNDLLEEKNVQFKKKITIIPSGASINPRAYKFYDNNYKIIFLGNIKYYPNKIACYNFAKNVMPKINKYFKDVEFHIIGKINFIDKFILGKNNKIKIHGPIINIKKILKNAICGINNVDISTGFQTKVLNYMSYGLPTLSLKKFKKNEFKNNKEIIYFKSDIELIQKISKLKTNKKFSEGISKTCYLNIKKNYSWNKRLYKYQKLL
jgi:glycosyltransferase involved in cell wall biosynthesis